jgi:hypothetical protein
VNMGMCGVCRVVVQHYVLLGLSGMAFSSIGDTA